MVYFLVPTLLKFIFPTPIFGSTPICPSISTWPSWYQVLGLCKQWCEQRTPTMQITMDPTWRNIRTCSNIFSISSCIFFGRKIHQNPPISYTCNNPSSQRIEKLWKLIRTPWDSGARRSKSSCWSNAVHICPYMSIDYLYLRTVNAYQCRLQLSIHWMFKKHDINQPIKSAMSAVSCTSVRHFQERNIYTMFHWHPTSSYIPQKHV